MVSEGVSDHEVLKLILSEIGKAKGLNIHLELISPAIDETTRIRERGGWGKVQAWCKKHGSEQIKDDFSAKERNLLKQAGINCDFLAQDNKRPSWQTLVTMSEASGLLIHLDADIAEKITGLDRDYIDSDKSRKEYCQHAIQYWIGSAEEHQLHFVTPAYCLETWYLAIHDHATNPEVIKTQINDYEAVENVISILLEIGYEEYIDQETGIKSIDKKLLTEKYSSLLKNNMMLISSRCPELKRVDSYIINFKNI